MHAPGAQVHEEVTRSRRRPVARALQRAERVQLTGPRAVERAVRQVGSDADTNAELLVGHAEAHRARDPPEASSRSRTASSSPGATVIVRNTALSLSGASTACGRGARGAGRGASAVMGPPWVIVARSVAQPSPGRQRSIDRCACGRGGG